MTDKWGVRLYCGMPRTGKTSLALVQIAAQIHATGLPVLGIDSTGAENLRKYPHAPSVQAAIDGVWLNGAHTFYIPKDEKEFEQLIGATGAAGNCILFIDEIGFWIKGGGWIPPRLAEIFRAFHHKQISMYATSQTIGDFAPLARMCATEFYCFRVSDGDAASRIEKTFNFKAQEIGALSVGQCLRWTRWGGVDYGNVVDESKGASTERGEEREGGGDPNPVLPVRREADGSGSGSNL